MEEGRRAEGERNVVGRGKEKRREKWEEERDCLLIHVLDTAPQPEWFTQVCFIFNSQAILI
jgi:hypothetical protein